MVQHQSVSLHVVNMTCRLYTDSSSCWRYAVLWRRLLRRNGVSYKFSTTRCSNKFVRTE